jgi:uncharacterized protein (TIGR03435 family)
VRQCGSREKTRFANCDFTDNELSLIFESLYGDSARNFSCIFVVPSVDSTSEYRGVVMYKGCVWRCLLVATVLFPAALRVCAQTAPAQNQDATIEVAVVRPHPSAVMHNNFSFQGNRFELEDQPLLKLIAYAYSLNARQIVGAPGWVEARHWDMSGTTNLTADATLPQEQQLVRQLLKERFGLQFHREKREMPAYALQLVNGRPKLTAAADPNVQPLEWTQGHGSQRTENYRSSTMTDFILIKQLFMDRPIVDQTGLTGRYDFKLAYTYGDAPDAEADAPPTQFTAIKEQLGLKFESVKAPVNALVIDRVETPTAN